MKTMLLAAAAALSIGISSAYADGGESPTANTLFTELPGVIAQAQVQAPSIATARNGQAIGAYVAHSHSQGTWLFAPDQFGGGNQ